MGCVIEIPPFAVCHLHPSWVDQPITTNRMRRYIRPLNAAASRVSQILFFPSELQLFHEGGCGRFCLCVHLLKINVIYSSNVSRRDKTVAIIVRNTVTVQKIISLLPIWKRRQISDNKGTIPITPLARAAPATSLTPERPVHLSGPAVWGLPSC